jgi:nicotinamide-nucleotide amidase
MAPRVAVLSTGTELLRGRGTDTNLATFARALEAVGLEIRYHATCGDDFGRLVDELKLAAARADIVLMSGGLGPTDDDLTRPAIAEAFHRGLEFRPRLWKEIRARFRRFKIPMAAINRRQAEAPEGSRSLPNPNGSAPGFELEADGVYVACLPGPPREMKPMLDGYVVPSIVKRFRPSREWRLWEARTIGMAEGDVDVVITRIIKRHGCGYGITAKGGIIHVTVKGRPAALKRVARDFRKAVGRAFLCEGEKRLEDVVVGELLKRKVTIAVAESCTGGLVASRLTDVAGVSDVLLEGVVTYSNGSKIARLGVRAATLEAHGAVSEQCAREMAEGVARTSGASMGVATTGIAGPGGGTREKPVGLVYHAVHYRGRTRVERRVFPGERPHVKERAAMVALAMVRRELAE